MTMEPNENDFVKDDTGDVGGAPERPEYGTQTIPDDAAVGEPGPDDAAQTQAAKGFLQMLLQLFTPQPTGRDENGNPINPSLVTTSPQLGDPGKAEMERIRDALRYVATQAPKVNMAGARWVTFPRHAVGDSPTRIAGYQPNRRRVLISNVGADVYLGEGMDLTEDSGFLLATGDEVEIFTQDEIYATCGASNSTVIYTVVELFDQ